MGIHPPEYPHVPDNRQVSRSDNAGLHPNLRRIFAEGNISVVHEAKEADSAVQKIKIYIPASFLANVNLLRLSSEINKLARFKNGFLSARQDCDSHRRGLG